MRALPEHVERGEIQWRRIHKRAKGVADEEGLLRWLALDVMSHVDTLLPDDNMLFMRPKAFGGSWHCGT